MDTRTKKIAELNDEVRQRCLIWGPGHQKVPCQIIMTRGIAGLGPKAQYAILKLVRDYDEFTEDNDPHGERDFGTFTSEGEKIIWKIDYYDKHNTARASQDPTDLERTIRVLTIMLADEY